MLEARRRMALYELSMLSGQEPAALIDNGAPCQTIPTLAAPLPAGDAWRLLERRPDIKTLFLVGSCPSEVIKLDLALVRGIDGDRARRAIVRKIRRALEA